MGKKIKRPLRYMDITIERNAWNGMYIALTSQGFVQADTIDGIKHLIREREKPAKAK